MMKKILTLTTLFAALLTLVGCEKTEDDTPDGMIEIFAESMNGGSKVILDGLDATWRSGDEIRINGSTATVKRRGDRAYISNASISEGTNRALYPASLSTVNWGTDNPTITFPAYYHYRTDSAGHQVLDLPMAAYSTGSTPLQFKHLTGALYITVKNNHSAPLKLLSVVVYSSHSQISGSKEVNINTFSISPSAPNSNGDRYVSMVFDNAYTLDPNASIRVMLPILPVAVINQFTIKVKSYVEGQPAAYLYSNTQPSGRDNSLDRNELGYAPVDITASGSTSYTDQIDGHYLVRTPLEFSFMTNEISNGTIANNAYIDILCDINMSGYPITAIKNTSFYGTLDGHGYTISNLAINSVINGVDYSCALFGCVSTPTIKNINIYRLSLNHTIDTRYNLRVGSIIGYSDPQSGNLTIDNCHVSILGINIGTISGNIYFGGIAGDVKDANISDCEVIVNSPFSLSGKMVYFGGMVGSINMASTSINNSRWMGSANIMSTSNTKAGGMIGNKAKGNLSVQSCEVSSELTISSNGSNNYYGSMIGFYNQGSSIVDTTSNHLSFVVNNSPVATHFGN